MVPLKERRKKGRYYKMKNLKAVLFFSAILGLYHCGEVNENSTGPIGGEDVLRAPGELRVEKIGDGEVWLNWQASGDEGDVLYIVYRAVGDGEAVAVDSTFRTSFQDRELEYELDYTYYVKSLDSAKGESEPSNSVNGQPLNNLAPLAPTLVRAIAHHSEILDQRDIVLDWAENGEGDLIGYRIYRATQESFTPSSDFLRSEVFKPRFVDEEIEVGTVYFYIVTAVDRGGKESPVSEVVSDVALPLPVLVAPVEGELTSSRPTFTWNPLDEARSFRVVVTTEPSSGEISDIPLTTGTSAQFVGRVEAGNSLVLEAGRIYWWKVVASTQEGGVENSVSRPASFKIR